MNPVSYARYLSTISTTALARKLEVSRQYISRLEQGMYDKPNHGVLDWTVSQFNKSGDKATHTEVINAYHEWQKNKRLETKSRYALASIQPSPEELKKIEEDPTYTIKYYKVFKDWREEYWLTPHNFCVEMCIHPGSVVNYEEGKLGAMPHNLRKLLKDLNLLGQNFKTYSR